MANRIRLFATALCLLSPAALQSSAMTGEGDPAARDAPEASGGFWNWDEPIPLDSQNPVADRGAAAQPETEGPEVGSQEPETPVAGTDEATGAATSSGSGPPVEEGAIFESEASASSSQAGAAPIPEVPVAQEADQSVEPDLGDWDWEGVVESDVVTVRPSTNNAGRRTSTKREGPRVGATAAPDLERTPLPAQLVFADSPDFTVVPSKKDTDMHPCSDCHEWAESDLTPRSLQDPHDNFALEHGLHGRGEFWCFTCHDLEGGGGLRTLQGVPLGFDDAYLLCAQCHADEARDWSFGAHGKRVGNWNGERTIMNCTVCHYQHRPKIEARAPKPPRPVPAFTDRKHDHAPPGIERIWERYSGKEAAEANHGP